MTPLDPDDDEDDEVSVDQTQTPNLDLDVDRQEGSDELHDVTVHDYIQSSGPIPDLMESSQHASPDRYLCELQVC